MSLSILFYSSCTDRVDGDDVQVVDSEIWVSSIVNNNDPVKIFIGSTSGLGSGDIAEYRDDAKVEIYINPGSNEEPLVFDYYEDNTILSGGYYNYYRLTNANPGDTLLLRASIPNSDFKEIQATTVIPNSFSIDSIEKDVTVNTFKELRNVNLKIYLDSIIQNEKEKYFELLITNFIYYDSDTISGSNSENKIDPTNNIKLKSGMRWSENLNSILIDYDKLDSKSIEIGFSVDDNFYKNKISIELRSVNKEYYDYFVTLDNGFLNSTNIINGVGIFSGYSKDIKTIEIK
ncbi:MAG: DUF4249 family protein [Saprospiraceae bacterium]